MGVSDQELRDVARSLLLIQAALPAIFVAGMLAASQTIRRTVERARRRIRRGGQEAENAAQEFLAGSVALFSLVALTLGLFIIPTLEISLYVAGRPSSLTDFIKLQVGTYAIVWGILTGFLFIIVPRVR